MFQQRNRHVAGLALAALLGLTTSAGAAQSDAGGGPDERPSFRQAAAKILRDLETSKTELSEFRKKATEEKLPLSRELTELQRQLIAAQAELKAVTRTKNDGALKLSNLTKTIEDRKAEVTYLSNNFGEYGRNFESRLHIAEKPRYDEELEAARLAPENSNLSQAEVFAAQVRLLDVSLGRLFDVGGGVLFSGTAVDETGLVREGRFAVIGPVGYFRSEDGNVVGTAETPLNSLEATVQSFSEPADTEAAAALVQSGSGSIPFDASLGNAHKIAATKETFVEHVQKGGVIIYPILLMAALALLVALYKWLTLLFVKKPRRKALDSLMSAIDEGDEDSARRRVKEIKGPAGRMLEAGVESMRRSRDLMEEVMYEKLLVTKTQLQKGLPFIAVCAASAPLLGLLGTVTGIINTFKQITVFGSGDVKQLSGGISEALITTKFGLIVAIPSLLLHAYLSRRARSVTTHMESGAVRLANEVAKSDAFGEGSYGGARRVPTMLNPDHELVRGQVAQVLTDMLGPLSNDQQSVSGAQTATEAGGVTP